MRVEYSKGERASKELILLHRQTSEATSGQWTNPLGCRHARP
jgi:hypothetical protein